MKLPIILMFIASTIFTTNSIIEDKNILTYETLNNLLLKNNASSTFINELDKNSIFINGDNKVYLNSINNNTVIEDLWMYNEVKTVSLNLDFSELDTSNRYIDVTLPLGIEMVTNPESLIDNKVIIGCDMSEFNKIKIPSTNSSYIHKPKMGKVRFYLSDNLTKVSLDILVKVDDIMWSTVNNALAHNKTDKAIIISISDGNNSYAYKLDNIKVIGNDWSIYRSADTSSIIMTNTEYSIDLLTSTGYIQSTQPRYHKNVTTKIEIPNYTYMEDGLLKTVYASINSVNIASNGTYEILDNYIYIKWNNIYEHRLKVNIKYQFNEELPTDELAVKFNYGDLYTEDYFTGTIHTLSSLVKKNMTIISNTKEKISMSGTNKNVYSGFFSNKENVNNILGGFSLHNYGATSNYEKYLSLNFPYGSTSSFGITKIVLPTIKNHTTYNLEVSIWNNKTNEELSEIITVQNNISTEQINLNILDILPDMGITDNYESWFLKDINYKIGIIPSSWGFSYYAGNNSKGVFYGKHLNGSNTEITNIKLKTITDNGELILDKECTSKSIPGNKGIATGGITSFNFYDENNKVISEINAGNNIRLTGIAEASGYSYFNSLYFPEPVLYLRLPKGLNINKEESTFRIEGAELSHLLSFEIKNLRDLNDGSCIYEISFSEKNANIGYYTNAYGTFGKLKFDINIIIPKSLRTTSINIRDTLFLSDKTLTISGSGSWDSYFTIDKFDINSNGDTKDKVSTFNSDRYLNINASSTWLDVDISSEGSSSNGGKDYQPIEDTSHIIKYGLTINNNNDGYVRARKMDYFIPIPKKDIEYNSYIKEDNENFAFNMELVDKVEDIPGFDILYTYDNKDYFNYSESIDLSKVSMIKIVNARDISPGEIIDIKASIKYAEDTWSGDKNVNSWNIYGQQTYEKNGSESTYLHVLDTFNVELILNPKILDNPESKSVKVGSNVSFSTNIDVGVPIAVGNWQYKPLNSLEWIDLSETSTTLTIENADYSMNGNQYRYKATNKGATVESLPATLTVTDNEAPLITLNEFKEGDIYKITITATDNGSGISHIILPNGTRINSNTYTMIADVNIEYTFKVYDLAGNESIKSTMIGVLIPKNVTSNLDMYIKSENMLSLSLNTNIITFDEFSGAEDLIKENAINITISSSLPYELNAYLPTEIQNSDKSATMDKQILNIKEDSETEYKSFTNINEKLVLKDNCIAGNGLIHGIDIKLKGSIAHEKNIYKTTIKFEVIQK